MTGRMLVVLTALLTAGTGAEPLSSSSPELLSEVSESSGSMRGLPTAML